LHSEDVRQRNEDLDMIQTSLRQSLGEMRVIAAGLRLPELENLTLPETLTRVVRVHERRTETKVQLHLNELPVQVPLPVKITLYRLIQEALHNAYRHGGGVGQEVRVTSKVGKLCVTVSDQGPGFDWEQVVNRDKHLGLVGMRERVESLGGWFQIKTAPGQGTTIIASLSLPPGELTRVGIGIR
jgi:hypothetical protein